MSTLARHRFDGGASSSSSRTRARAATPTTQSSATNSELNAFRTGSSVGAAKSTAYSSATTASASASTSGSASASASASGSGRSSSQSASASASSSSLSSGHFSCVPGCDSPRVVYGSGTVARLPTELGRLHLTSPLIVSSPSRVPLARRMQALIPNLDSRILDSAVVNVPARVVEDAVSRISGRDCVISVGGGSAVRLAKAIGLRKGIPHICIPTTYSGSEVVPLPDPRHADQGRFAGRDPMVMPTVVIYDEDLTTMSSPKRFSAPTALSAAAHASESRMRRSGNDDTPQWSFMQLPGV